MTAQATQRTVEAIWRIESAKLIARLVRLTRDVGQAEELAQDALVAALEQWPRDGVPDNPGAWLMAIAKRKGVDALRRRKMMERKHADLAPADEAPFAEPDDVGDDLLRLIFVACHPVLPNEARLALALRLLCGLTVPEIARAFLASETAIQQRLVRAKKTLATEKVPFEVPEGDELHARISSVLEVIYLLFNEGYAATAGDDWMRPALCDEALRLGRVVAELLPQEPEVHGLAALMEIQASRARARVGANGEPILLLEQNRALRDHLLIQRGLVALQRAESLSDELGPITLQAAIAACHARARVAAETDWAHIVALYDELLALTPSPVVALNRAVAVSKAVGPAAALALIDELVDEPVLRSYHLLPSVRGDLLLQLGRYAEAKAELEKAAALAQNIREKELLSKRAQEAQRLQDESPRR